MLEGAVLATTERGTEWEPIKIIIQEIGCPKITLRDLYTNMTRSHSDNRLTDPTNKSRITLQKDVETIAKKSEQKYQQAQLF
jgi:hypothetical protein